MALRPPSLIRLLREIADVPAIVAAPLRTVPVVPVTGHGQPVLVLPGFLANDAATSLLRRTIDAAGYRSFGWGMGSNIKVKPNMPELINARVEQVSAAAGGARVALVGWSLGGLYARQVANAYPSKIALVMTLGSPFRGELKANNAWRLIELTNSLKIEDLPRGFEEKPPVHTVAVWSARDGIVTPETSCGEPSQSDERIELTCTHMGFCASSDGARDVTKLLAGRI